MRTLARLSVSLLSCVAVVGEAERASAQREPIIDVHMHATPANYFGSPPHLACAVELTFSPRDPREPFSSFPGADCRSPLVSPMNDEQLLQRMLSLVREYNITGILSGRLDLMQKWKSAAPERLILSASGLPADSIRTLAANGTIRVIGEFAPQLAGYAPSDSALDEFYALAVEMDIPLGLHIGPGACRLRV